MPTEGRRRGQLTLATGLLLVTQQSFSERRQAGAARRVFVRRDSAAGDTHFTE